MWIARLATGMGVGYCPYFPGTVGTFWGIPFVLLFALTGHIPYLVLVLISVIFATFIADRYDATSSVHDSREIVIDEVIGYIIAMTWLPLTWQSFLGTFLLFRFLDIVKPFPINYIDKRFRGGIGIVADDILAGLITNIVFQIIFIKTNWLGIQLFPM